MACEFLKTSPTSVSCECANEIYQGKILESVKQYVITTELDYDLVECNDEFAILRTFHPMFSELDVRRTTTEYQFTDRETAIKAFGEVTMHESKLAQQLAYKRIYEREHRKAKENTE